jgi:DNA gyrase/topoisomerase IV subunit A
MRGPRAHRKRRGAHLRLVVIKPGSDALNDGNHIRGLGLATRRRRAVIPIQTTARCRHTCRHTTDAEAMRDEAMLCSSNRGILVRTPGGDIGVVDRNTEGVRPIDLLEDERLVGMEGFEDYEQG